VLTTVLASFGRRSQSGLPLAEFTGIRQDAAAAEPEPLKILDGSQPAL